MSQVALTHRPKVIFCDVDKTLTATNTWFTLTEALHGNIETHFQLYSAYVKGSASYEEMKTGLFKMWEAGYGARIQKHVLEDIFFKIQLRGEAFSTFAQLRDLGYIVCLISSSIDMFVEMVAQRLLLDNWYANSKFVFDKDGYWIDFEYDKDEAGLKLHQVQTFLKDHHIQSEECLILGDGSTEIELFKHFAGIAVDSENEELKKLAWKEIKYLPTLLQVLEKLE